MISENRTDFLDDAAIDRLVDGDLPEADRRALILRLEADPEACRRCALAFLEDQAFRKALAPSASRSSETTPTPFRTLPRVPRGGNAWIRRASIAASVIASTFAAGFAAGGFSRAVPGAEVARVAPPVVEPVAAVRSGEVHEVGSFRVVDASAGESTDRRVPILSGPGLDDRWLRDQPPTVPDYVRARWERQGYQVEERRNLVSVELGDGRRVAIPLDEVEVDYVGQRPL